jgi:hypothetical protein
MLTHEVTHLVSSYPPPHTHRRSFSTQHELGEGHYRCTQAWVKASSGTTAMSFCTYGRKSGGVLAISKRTKSKHPLVIVSTDGRTHTRIELQEANQGERHGAAAPTPAPPTHPRTQLLGSVPIGASETLVTWHTYTAGCKSEVAVPGRNSRG